MATLTFVYAQQTAVLGPLARQNDPGSYDLCEVHAERTSPPRGWEILRLPRAARALAPDEEDLLALAEAVREIGLAEEPMRAAAGDPMPGGEGSGGIVELGRRGHLRVITDAERRPPRLR